MRLSNAQSIFFGLLLAVLALWITTHQNKPQSPQTVQVAAESYNWQSSDSTTWKINRHEPDTQTIFQTSIFRYNEASKQSDFSQPFITQLLPDSLITLKSQQGQSQNNERIKLSGQVVIKQFDTQGASEKMVKIDVADDRTPQTTTLNTDYITYNATNGELETDAPVTIIQSNGVTTAIGLHAYLDTGRYLLLNEVKGIYHLKPTLESTKATD